jgi:ADP-ribose pyrophosphatase YjhB (NUDIX family)
MTMITLSRDDVRFTFRVVGVAIHHDRVLLHQAEGDDFWALPGGRAELLEPAPETLRREMVEELSAEVEVVRLLWVAENFFMHQGLHHHELGLYFLMHFAPSSPVLRHAGAFDGYEGHTRLIFQWFPVADLAQLRLYPSFLRQGLSMLPATVQHVVHTDV